MEFRTQYTPRVRVQHVNLDAEKTVQAEKDACDVNKIIKRYRQTGVMTHLNRAQARFMDVSMVTDYQTALETVEAARASFMELSAAQRKVFDNSPAKFLDAAHDPAKRDLLVAAGLVPELSHEPGGASAPDTPADPPQG